ncbi:unnamed protein product [Arabis nemorensis]|uniref:Uncharacterized protein n=1 Tax=Arabis nemorensis TaxID=586526 RepID=A0A565CE90_9BRAS|nr:unnamed protein product [Arabis nemorensis]
MKQCDRGLSPFAPPFAIGSSFAASESDPDDSFWGDFTFDFSFLTSDDQKSGVGDDDSLSNLSRLADSTTVPPPKAEESERYGLAAYGLGAKGDFALPVKDQRFDLEIRKGGNSDSFLKLPDFLDSDLKCVDSKPRISPSLAVVPLKASGLGVTRITPVAKNVVVSNDNSGDDEAEGWLPCTKDKSAMVRKDINVSNSSPLFAKMSKSFIPSDQDDVEVDSPCWRGTQSHNSAASGTMSLSFRRSSEDLNSLYRLNPLAPQFIPSSAKKNLDKNEKEFEENSSSSLKRSLSSTFPPSSGEFSITDPSEAEIPQDSGQKNRIEILINDADESLGLISQDSVSKTMSILDISSQFQMPKKLDPLAPVFVPASAKLSAVVHEKHGVADHMIAIETNAQSSYALSASEDMFLNNAEVATHSSEVDHSSSNPYSNYVHESGRSYPFNPRLGSQVKISENTKLDSSSNKSRVPKKLNPLAPQFSLADTKQKVYGCENNQAANDFPSQVNCSVLFSPPGYRNLKEQHPGFAQSSVDAEPSFNEVGTMQMEHLPPITLHGNSSLKYVSYQPTKVDDNFVSTGKLAVDPKAVIPVKDNNDFGNLLPFHIFEPAVSSSSSDVKYVSDFGQRHGCSTSSPSPKMDVKKLLTTMHGLSELLTHVHGPESSDLLNEQDLDLINCTVQNLNAYANSRVQEHNGNYSSSVHNPSDFNSLPSMRKLSIKDHRIPKAENMSANLDVKRQEKYSMVSGEIGADSHFEYGVTKENGFGKVLGNYQTEEQISPQVFFYKSLWLKAKADRSLMEYETFLSKTRV